MTDVNSPSSNSPLDLSDASLIIQSPCTACGGTGVMEVGPEGTMKTRTMCSVCMGTQKVNYSVGLGQLAGFIEEAILRRIAPTATGE